MAVALASVHGWALEQSRRVTELAAEELPAALQEALDRILAEGWLTPNEHELLGRLVQHMTATSLGTTARQVRDELGHEASPGALLIAGVAVDSHEHHSRSGHAGPRLAKRIGYDTVGAAVGFAAGADGLLGTITGFGAAVGASMIWGD